MAGEERLPEELLAAFRAAEPRRRRDPFADPRLALIADERRRRSRSRWRGLSLAPAPAFAGACLALLIAVAPLDGGVGAGDAAADRSIAAPELQAPAVAGAPLERAAPTPVWPDGWRLLPLGLGGLLALVGVRRLRRRS